MKNHFITAILIGFTSIVSAQYNYRDSNRIGIGGGINQFTMNSSDFESKPGIGWQAGLSVRGNFYNDFDMVYDIRFSENQFSVKEFSPIDYDIKCKIQSAQISLLLSYKFIENHLSVEFGPMFQFNGKLDIRDEDLDRVISNNLTTAKDIQDIPFFNLYPTVGITGGIREVRAHLFAQYGVLNMFRGTKSPTGDSIEGHGLILGGNICFYF